MTVFPKHRFVIWFLFVAGNLATAADPSNWPRWRGTDDNGSIEGGSYPVKWSTDDALWKASLPGKGCSTPIDLSAWSKPC